jgi:PTH1 family peptidyl-tRNA hydrolase
MNNSGIAARQAIEYLRLKPASLFVIYDELDLPLGKIRVRKKGSAGGHKGMQSIIQHLDTEDFPRLRLGIGPQDEGVAAEDFVLATFRPEEEPAVREIIQLSIVVVQDFIRNGIEYTMAKYNPLQFSCAEKPGDSV